MHKLVLSVGVCGTVMVLAGCSTTKNSKGDTAGSGNKGDIVIGFAAAETGGFAGFDGALINGAKVAVNDINAKGGVLGRKLRIIVADSQSKIDGSAPAAQSLLAKGVAFMGATSDYDFGGPAMRAANSAGVVGMVMAGDTRLGYHGTGPLVFNPYHGSAAEGVVMAQFAYSKGWKRPYVLTDTINSYPKTVTDAFVTKWKSLAGQNVVGRDLFLNSDTSVRTQVDAMKAANPDVLLVASFPPGGTAAIRQIRAAGIAAPILGDIAFDGTAWISAVPNLSDVYVPEFVVAGSGDAKTDKFLADYKKLAGADSIAPTYSAIGYSEVQIMAEGVRVAKTTKGKDVAAAISKIKGLETMIGPVDYTWRAQCNVPASIPYSILQVQKGKETVLTKLKAEGIPPFKC